MKLFALQWYVSDGLFEAFGKERVTPRILPGNFDERLECTGANFTARVHAWVKSGPSKIITSALLRPFMSGDRLLIPWCNTVCPRIVFANVPNFQVFWM